MFHWLLSHLLESCCYPNLMRGNINGQCKSVYPGLPRHAGRGVAAGAVATPAPKVMGRKSALLVARRKCPLYCRNLWELMEVEVDSISFA